MPPVNNALRQLWVLTDGKPGHMNQLRGLVARLGAHCAVDARWLNVAEIKASWWQRLAGAVPLPALPAPALVLGAGHGTHPLLRQIGRHYSCPTVVLMTPSLPLNWFDYAIVPIHDQPPPRPNVLATQGALNTVLPRVRSTEPSRGLILLGGTSRHYAWNTTEIIHQVERLVQQLSHISWVVSDSRRTPGDLLPQLQARLPDLQILPHQQTPAGWVAEQMDIADCVWVTPDSVSMVYEALTSGAQVGLFDATISRSNRINRSIEALRHQKSVYSVATAASQANNNASYQEPLWEAERAAVWLLAQLAWKDSIL